jgi:protein-S-isoprenylcysteine O-methyltransferase Ste14
MNNLIIPSLWALWIAVWLVLARGAKKTQWRENFRSRMSYAAPGAVAFISLAFTAPPDQFWFRPLLPWSPAFLGIGVFLMLAGFALTIWARLVLADNWSATVTLKQDHELISRGPYRLVRHPIYSGLLLAAFGTALPRDDLRAVAAMALILLSILRKAGIEEVKLSQHFGTAYRDYRQRTKMLIPYLL